VLTLLLVRAQHVEAGEDAPVLLIDGEGAPLDGEHMPVVDTPSLEVMMDK